MNKESEINKITKSNRAPPSKKKKTKKNEQKPRTKCNALAHFIKRKEEGE